MGVVIEGSSDDLIEIDGDIREEFYANGEEEDSLLAFSDGTVLRIIYPDSGVWRISPVVSGHGTLVVEQAPEDDDEVYSDIATLDGTLSWVVYGTEMATNKGV